MRLASVVLRVALVVGGCAKISLPPPVPRPPQAMPRHGRRICSVRPGLSRFRRTLNAPRLR